MNGTRIVDFSFLMCLFYFSLQPKKHLKGQRTFKMRSLISVVATNKGCVSHRKNSSGKQNSPEFVSKLRILAVFPSSSLILNTILLLIATVQLDLWFLITNQSMFRDNFLLIHTISCPPEEDSLCLHVSLYVQLFGFAWIHRCHKFDCRDSSLPKG